MQMMILVLAVVKIASYGAKVNHVNIYNGIVRMGNVVVVVWQTTAGWRNAPASAQRVSTRGLARVSPISLKNTMNTKGLEWFGPPERNTLRPLCVVLPCLERVCESLGESECVI